MPRIIELPIIVCGEEKYPKDNYIQINYTNDVIVRITRPTAEDFERIYSYREPLYKIPLHKITKYLTVFARYFFEPQNQLRREAIELSSHVTGYTRQMLARDYAIITSYLAQRVTSYDTIESELGDYRVLDSWVRTKVARIRAFPRGRALHVLVGNVPLTGIYSVFRSILTKNQTVVKLPSRDIVSTLYFMRALIAANSGDDGRPYKKILNSSLSALYLDSSADEFRKLVEASDVVCAWGKGKSLKSIKEKVPYGTPFLEFGPKRSYSLLFTQDADLDQAAVRIAHDLSLYDQEACLCPQRLFIVGPHEEFLGHLQKWLDWQAKSLPRGVTNPDVESHIFRMELEAKFRKWPIVSNDPQWRIIVCDPFAVGEHPLGRTLFIHPVKSEEELLPFIDEETQAISVFPYDHRAEALGELFCSRGASKLCETGMSMYPREGWTHDGSYPLRHFVRLCYLDENMSYVYKYENEQVSLAFLRMIYGRPTENVEEFLQQFPMPD